MSGRRKLGECGHEHEAVFAQFYVCTVSGCDGVLRCPRCGDTDVEPFTAPNLPAGSMHCMKNGHVWWNP